MLMEESSEPYGQEQTKKSENAIVTIGNDPVMQSAVDILSILGSTNQVVLKAKGNSIPNAVAVANIITEKMLKGNSKVQKITLDTESAAGIGRMTSTIKIILNKI
jgi:DNA-binding protein